VARASLPASDVRALGTFRTTAPARTLVDCAREWPLEDAVVAMDATLHAGLLSHADLTGAVLAQRHWAGIGDAARAANLADARAESPLETLGRLRILGSGLPAPELQVEIRDLGRPPIGVIEAFGVVDRRGQARGPRSRRC
jgi:hypothetical protein